MKTNKKRKNKKASGGFGSGSDKPRCELCGKQRNLMQTECCGHWICDDRDKYVLFSYARNSCARNHQRFTLCGFHFNEGHAGNWKTCAQCRAAFEHELEMYVYYGTNEYNFEKLLNPPPYQATHCAKCGNVIKLSEDGYSSGPKGYQCETCTAKSFPLPR